MSLASTVKCISQNRANCRVHIETCEQHQHYLTLKCDLGTTSFFCLLYVYTCNKIKLYGETGMRDIFSIAEIIFLTVYILSLNHLNIEF